MLLWTGFVGWNPTAEVIKKGSAKEFKSRPARYWLAGNVSAKKLLYKFALLFKILEILHI